MAIDQNGACSSALGAALGLASSDEKLKMDGNQQAREKKPAEQVARLRFLEAALACSADGVVVVDAAGRLVFLNDAAQRLLHKPPAGATPFVEQAAQFKLRYPDGRPMPPAETPLGRALQGETCCACELMLSNPDGGDAYLSATASPVRDEQGTALGAVLIFRDITEQKQTAEKLLQTTSALQAVLHSLPDLIFRQDAAGTYLDYYAGRPEDLYAAPEIFLGRRTRDVLPSPVADQLQKAIGRALETNAVVTVEYALPIAGKEQFFEARVAPLPGNQTVSVVRNITERKRAEEELRVYARVIDSSSDFISVVDREYRYRMVNPTYTRWLAKPIEEILGHTAAEIMGENAFQTIIRPNLDRCFGGEQVHYEAWLDFPIAGRRYMDVYYYPLFRNDEVEYAVVVARDTTERKQAERFREEYVALISHDLRAPLTILQGQADWLRRLLMARQMEREAHSAEAILKSARRMNDMIEELIESARLEAGHFELRKEPTDLLRLIGEVLDRMVGSADRARIRLECPEWVPPVLADPARIERVVVNFLTNALKYSPPEAPVTVRLTQEDGKAVVAVADQGAGIPPEDLPNIFQRFYRGVSGKRTEGLGLGLYITRLIVEAHGGRVCVDSKVGKGSIFYFTLPLAGH